MKTAIRSGRRAGKLKAALLSVTLSGLLLSGNAAAQWAVIDPAHIETQMAEFAQQAARWGEQGQQWLKEYQQWKQQYDSWLSSISSMQSNFGLVPGSSMEEVDENTYMVEERCGPPYGGGTAGVFGRLTGIDTRTQIQKQRWELCAKLQVARNKQYNEVVKYLNETAPAMQAEMNKAGQQFVGSGKTQGDMTAYAAKMNKVDADAKRTHDEFQARMQGYDAYAKAVEVAQGGLTRSTMRGGAGMIEKVVNGGVMYTALCGGGKCD